MTLLRHLLLAAALALTGCSAGDSSDCSPACSDGLICCNEPSHLPSPDGGVGTTARCATPSQGLCPKQP